MRKAIAIILLIAAAAGPAYGIPGATQKTIRINSNGAEGLCMLSE